MQQHRKRKTASAGTLAESGSSKISAPLISNSMRSGGVPVIERVELIPDDPDRIWVKVAGRETIKVAKKRLLEYSRFQNVLRYRFGAEYDDLPQEAWAKKVDVAMLEAGA